MRHEFALDHLPTTAVEPADPERRVPNPVIKEKKREVGRIQAKLTKAEQAYGHKAHEHREQKVPTVRGFNISHAELGRTITRLRSTRAQLEAAIQALPTRVPVRETMGTTPIVQLERERKIITDTFKMVAYRAETQLANLVGPLLPHRNDEARKFLRHVFQLPADLLPDHDYVLYVMAAGLDGTVTLDSTSYPVTTDSDGAVSSHVSFAPTAEGAPIPAFQVHILVVDETVTLEEPLPNPLGIPHPIALVCEFPAGFLGFPRGVPEPAPDLPSAGTGGSSGGGAIPLWALWLLVGAGSAILVSGAGTALRRAKGYETQR